MAEPLSATHPEIAVQAHGWDPSTISRGSDQKLGWLCNMKHLYFATPSNRIKGSGCPYCAGKSALSGFNDMGTTHPELAAQADGWDPSQFIAGTAKKLPWKCASGHQWTVSGNSRVSQGTGCPVCSNKKIVAGINDLGSINPDLARQADGWDPSTSAPQSNKKRAWICPNDGEHRWEDSVSNRSKGRGCPYCSNHQIMVGFNDLNTTHPKVAIEACGWDPVTVVAGNRKKRLWECSVGHVWEASPVSRTRLSSGCPFCAGQRAIRGVNDLATIRPDIAVEADGWDPTEVMAQTNQKLPWTCVNDHSWITSVANRTNGTGCPTCSGNVVLAGFNDLGTTHPEIAAEANGWDPTTVSKGHITKKSWTCPMGHIYDATVNGRCQGRNCSICSGKKVLIGFNDLQTTHPELAAETDGWDPKTVTAGSNKKVSWKCANGHQWFALVTSRSFGTGCPSCARTGYDPNKKGFLYLLRHDQLGLLQIGKTNNPNERLRRHTRNGWEPIDLTQPLDGHLVSKLEQDIMKMLKGQGANFSEAEQIMGPQMTGRTEAWVMESVPVFTLKELRRMLHEGESI